MDLGLIARRYGRLDLTPVPIAGSCSSIDLRVATGAPPTTPDETCLAPPGVFALALFTPSPGALPVGEIRVFIAGREVRLVAESTGRPGLIELTLAHLHGAARDGTYASTLRGWLTAQARR